MENNKIFLDNVYFLIRQHQLKIGEFEKEIEVSNGYMSRLNKDSTTMPTLDMVQRIADYFQVSIDVLLKEKMNCLSDSEKKMIDFVGKLIIDVISNNIVWSVEPSYSFYENNNDDNIISYIYKEHENINLNVPEDGIYATKINDAKLVILNVMDMKDIDSYECEDWYEMFIVFEDGTYENIYHPTEVHSILDEKMLELYHLISINISKIKISKKAEDIINKYIK